MITPVNMYSQNNCRNVSNPAFTSVHCAKYFVKRSDGFFYRVNSEDLVNKLQNNIISKMLNQDYYEAQKSADAAVQANKVMSPAEMIKNALVKIFQENDAEYMLKTGTDKEYGYVSFFSAQNKSGDIEAYILTGPDMKILDDAEKMTKKTGNIEHFRSLVMSKIKKALSKDNPNNSEFSAYFIPGPKGKSPAYELIDAKFTSV